MVVTIIILNENGRAYKIIYILSQVGEYPTKSVYLLGENANKEQRRIHDMTLPQTYLNPKTGEKIEAKILNISGNGKTKTIRLSKQAIPILEWMGVREEYEKTSDKFRSDNRIDRNHRVAEVYVMFRRAGMEIQKEGAADENRYPLLYYAKSNTDIDKCISEQNEKVMFTRIIGLLLNTGVCMAVYNTRDTVMKWVGESEYKAKLAFQKTSLKITETDAVLDCLLFGKNYEVGRKMIESPSEKNTAQKNKLNEYSFFRIYRKVYFVPLSDFGVKLLGLLAKPDIDRKLIDILIPKESQRSGYGAFEFDGTLDGNYVFSFLNSDISRLERLRIAMELGVRAEIICFPEQVEYVQDMFGKYNVKISTVDIDDVIRLLK